MRTDRPFMDHRKEVRLLKREVRLVLTLKTLPTELWAETGLLNVGESRVHANGRNMRNLQVGKGIMGGGAMYMRWVEEYKKPD